MEYCDPICEVFLFLAVHILSNLRVLRPDVCSTSITTFDGAMIKPAEMTTRALEERGVRHPLPIRASAELMRLRDASCRTYDAFRATKEKALGDPCSQNLPAKTPARGPCAAPPPRPLRLPAWWLTAFPGCHGKALPSPAARTEDPEGTYLAGERTASSRGRPGHGGVFAVWPNTRLAHSSPQF